MLRLLPALALAVPLVMIGGPATAAPGASAIPVTVTPGGPFTAAGGPFVIPFDNGHTISCSTWRMGGDFTAQTLMLPPVELGRCYVDWAFTPTMVTVPQWPFTWHYYSPTLDATYGRIPDVAIQVTSGQCSFTVNGLSEFSYSNETGRLAVSGQVGPGQLVANNVSGCFGIRQGDRAKLGYGYVQVNPLQQVRPAAA